MSGKDPDDFKFVILVRNDIKMTKGKIAAQVAHSAVNCAFASKKNDPFKFNKWYDSGQTKIVLKVDSLRDLYEFKAIAEALGITCSLIIDAGRTQIEPGTVTCLGIGPEKASVLDKITGDLKMF
jgi:PTH2 family peptidyl-tRNA hydrolase